MCAGPYPWVEGVTLGQAVKVAGGPKDSKETVVRLVRGEQVKEMALDGNADYPLKVGDVVVVFRRQTAGASTPAGSPIEK